MAADTAATQAKAAVAMVRATVLALRIVKLDSPFADSAPRAEAEADQCDPAVTDFFTVGFDIDLGTEIQAERGRVTTSEQRPAVAHRVQWVGTR